MTGTDIVQRASAAPAPTMPAADELSHMMEVVRSISQTEFVPRQYRGNNAAILACILTGRGLGLDPMTSLAKIHLVDGKPTLSAEVMVALARKAGHSIQGESTAEVATVRGKRGDNGDEFTVVFTVAEADQAGLLNDPKRPAWKKYTADLLWARAVSRLCRRLFPDVLAGVSYTPEEATLTPEERNAGATEDLPLPPDEDSEPGVGTAAHDAALSADPGSEIVDATLSEPGGDGKSSSGTPGSESAVVEQDGQTALTIPAAVAENMRRERGE